MNRAALAALALTGAGVLFWRSRQGGQTAQAAQPRPMTGAEWLDNQRGGAQGTLAILQGGGQSAPNEGGDMGYNFNPLFGWAVDKIGGLFGGGNSRKVDDQSQGGSFFGALLDGPAVPPRALPESNGGGRSSGFVGGLLDLIGQAEAPGGYNQVYGGSKIQTPRPITTMSVRGVLAWQDSSVAAGSASSAVGRYQIIRDTLRGLVSQGVLSINETFDPEAQDRAAVALMEEKGLSRYQSGQLTREAFAQGLSETWAGLPAFTRDSRGRAAAGQSYYAGDGLNRATATQSQVVNALNRIRGGA